MRTWRHARDPHRPGHQSRTRPAGRHTRPAAVRAPLQATGRPHAQPRRLRQPFPSQRCLSPKLPQHGNTPRPGLPGHRPLPSLAAIPPLPAARHWRTTRTQRTRALTTPGHPLTTASRYGPLVAGQSRPRPDAPITHITHFRAPDAHDERSSTVSIRRLFHGPGVNAGHGGYSRLWRGQWRAGGVRRTVIVCGARTTRGPGCVSPGAAGLRVSALPVVPVHDLVEGPAVGAGERP
jgi:hypothetical protein